MSEFLDLMSTWTSRSSPLSMGNKKKVAVVASLIHNPPYLLLDEPLNGLDAFSARVLKEIVARKSIKGWRILLSTHIMEYGLPHITTLTTSE